MKNKLLHHIRFNATDSASPESLTAHVIMVIMSDGVLFGGLNEEGEVTTIRYGRPKEGVVYGEHEFIEHELINEPLLALPGKVSIFIADKRTLPVPLQGPTQWLSHVQYLLPNEAIQRFEVPEQNLCLEYAADDLLLDMLDRYVPDAAVYPFGLLLLPSLPQNCATIALSGNRFWISVHKECRLQGWHIELYSGAQDIAYSLLHLLRQSGLTQDIEVHGLSCYKGRIQLFETLQTYLPQVQLGTALERSKYGTWLTVVKLLQRAHLCAS